MRIFPRVVCALFLAMSALPAGKSDATEKNDSPAFCDNTLIPAIGDLVRHEFPESRGELIVIEAYNDLEYEAEESECMANVALVLHQAHQYAVFHIHYGREGKWIPQEVKGIAHPLWQKSIHPLSWKETWCGLMSLRMYQHELSKFGCDHPAEHRNPNNHSHHH